VNMSFDDGAVDACCEAKIIGIDDQTAHRVSLAGTKTLRPLEPSQCIAPPGQTIGSVFYRVLCKSLPNSELDCNRFVITIVRRPPLPVSFPRLLIGRHEVKLRSVVCHHIVYWHPPEMPARPSATHGSAMCMWLTIPAPRMLGIDMKK
jgi:hypothetical protein